MVAPLVIQLPPQTARLVLHPLTDPLGDEDMWTFRVELHDEGINAETTATVARFDNPPLTTYLRELKEAWQGWPGVRTWRSFEQELRLDACHDGLGHVTLRVTLRPPAQPYADEAWSAQIAFVIEAGEQMTGLVDAITAHIRAECQIG
ncbi:DUF6228 family protein [Dactylosporangium salmoneum]|uniref:DUF6228 family protein n=2 Tax=Dactylosporangium salmoneum TaxID=53361 RepID=A0ABN3G2L8_9ACTN